MSRDFVELRAKGYRGSLGDMRKAFATSKGFDSHYDLLQAEEIEYRSYSEALKKLAYDHGYSSVTEFNYQAGKMREAAKWRDEMVWKDDMNWRG